MVDLITDSRRVSIPGAMRALAARVLERYVPPRAAHFATWHARERAFIELLKSRPIPAPKRSELPIGIVIQPWLMTPLPWFLITIAVALRDAGYPVEILWDDLPFGPDTVVYRVMQRSVGRVLALVESDIPVRRLSQIPSGSFATLNSDIERLAALNTTIRFRGEVQGAEQDAYRALVTHTLRRTAGHVVKLAQGKQFAQWIIGGGVYGTSGLFLAAGRAQGLRVAGIDSGPGVLLLVTNGVAANLEDIPRAFDMLKPLTPEVRDLAKAEFERRLAGADAFGYQAVKAVGVPKQVGAVLTLNQSFDTAALGRHHVFSSQMEWITETVAWVLKNTDDTVVVRQHPIERHKAHAGNDGYAQVLQRTFGNEPRLQFVAADAEVNTYDLLRGAKVVVPYVSTVGIEAAVLGRPVVSQGKSHYADLGFVWAAKSRDEYFSYLDAALGGKLHVTEAMQDDAWLAYYLTQCRNFFFTDFTPTPTDFDRWVEHPIESILHADAMQTLFNVLIDNVPCSVVRHRREMEQLEEAR